jgi:hypothetical protein
MTHIVNFLPEALRLGSSWHPLFSYIDVATPQMRAASKISERGQYRMEDSLDQKHILNRKPN